MDLQKLKNEVVDIDNLLKRDSLSPKRRYDLTVRRRKLLKEIAEFNKWRKK